MSHLTNYSNWQLLCTANQQQQQQQISSREKYFSLNKPLVYLRLGSHILGFRLKNFQLFQELLEIKLRPLTTEHVLSHNCFQC